MGAKKSVKRAEIGGNPKGSQNRYSCSCHPPSWGLKKGLRRARRRLSRQIIINEQTSG